MINVKNEIQYILVTRLLVDMTQAGFMTAEELKAAKRRWRSTAHQLCGNSAGYSRPGVVVLSLAKEVASRWPQT